MELTELKQNFTKIVWVTRPTEQAFVANTSITAMFASKSILLHIRHCFEKETNREENNTNNVCRFTKSWTSACKLRHAWRVEDRDWHGDCPHPDHLKDPEPEKFEELVAHIVKAIIFASLEDAKQEKAR